MKLSSLPIVEVVLVPELDSVGIVEKKGSEVVVTRPIQETNKLMK